MTASEQMLALVEGSKNLRRLCREYETESVTVHLKELVGGAFSLYAAATIRRTGGVHVFVAEDRDAAAYLLNDLYALLDERRILFFPSSYKRSIVYGAEDAQGVVQRTAALNALRTPPAGYLALCTYPEALAERVVDAEALRRETMTVRAGDRLRPADREDPVNSGNLRRRGNRGVDTALLRRGDEDQFGDPCDLCGNTVHENRGGVGGASSGDVHADPLKRTDNASERFAVHREFVAVCQLAFMVGADVFRRPFHGLIKGGGDSGNRCGTFFFGQLKFTE